MLSQSEIDHFRREGFLVLRGFFPRDTVAAWKAETEAYFGNPQSGPDWTKAIQTIRHSQFHLTGDPKPGQHAALTQVFTDLYGPANWLRINEMVVTAPEPGVPWLGGRAPHLDFPVGCPERNLINLTFYLDDVASRGAAFSFWPQSHHAAHRYFRDHPMDYLARGARSQDAIFARLMRDIDTSLTEFTAEAGDLLLWSSLLMHSATVNMSDKTRMAVIGRWGDLPASPEAHFDFGREMFHDWVPEPA